MKSPLAHATNLVFVLNLDLVGVGLEGRDEPFGARNEPDFEFGLDLFGVLLKGREEPFGVRHEIGFGFDLGFAGWALTAL